MVKKLKIKDLRLKNNVFLAPMAGYTDVGFRSLCAKYGAGLTFTEMVSAKALCYGSEKTKELLNCHGKDKTVAVQLFGNDPESFKQVLISGMLDSFKMIDINMGCPAPKIVANKEGSFLMTDIARASEIIKACVESTKKPVSVKFRSGFSKDTINAVEFACMCEQSGASMITIHPRTKEQGYSGTADWEIVKEITKKVSIPVIVSGDIKSRKDLDYLVKECGASGVMVARASLGKPEIFEEILTNKPLNMSLKDKLTQIKEHIEIMRLYHSEKFVSMTMKKHILNYIKDFENATKLKVKVCECSDLDSMLKIISEYED